jgi:hypothetical protein
MTNEKDAVFETKYEWKPLDSIIRGWIAASRKEKEQEDYQNRKVVYQD